MRSIRVRLFIGFMLPLFSLPLAAAQPVPSSPLPDIHQLIHQVHEHQKQLDKTRENYTYTSLQTTQEMDASGRVTKTEVEEFDEFFVNGHLIGRMVKKDGKPLTESEQKKESARVSKAVEQAEKSMPPKDDSQISLRRILEVADLRNPRRMSYRNRPTIVFDFVGNRDLKAHGVAEDLSKKLQGTVWIDEADRVVAHLDLIFNGDFHIGGGLVANVAKGSKLSFDQATVNGEVWLPTGGEGTFQVRLLLLKSIRQHVIESDYDYKRFRVEAVQSKDARVEP